MSNADASPPIGWNVSPPWNGHKPDRLHVIGKEAACREAPAYPGKKISQGFLNTGLHIDVGAEIKDVLEHQEFLYKGRVLNFYRVPIAIDGHPAHTWIMDYSPNDEISLLEIQYMHTRAHQDDSVAYHLLMRLSQLNCLVDLSTKLVIWGLVGGKLPPHKISPLESVAVFVGNNKMASDTAETI